MNRFYVCSLSAIPLLGNDDYMYTYSRQQCLYSYASGSNDDPQYLFIVISNPDKALLTMIKLACATCVRFTSGNSTELMYDLVIDKWGRA